MQDGLNGSTGGAATHKGIWYQALWCVLQAAHSNIDGSGESTKLILEPFGGDARIENTGFRRVVQLKTKSRGTWSLKDTVEEVLPDLYRSVDLDDRTNTTYEFVTEGRLGRWQPVLKFFQSLGGRLSKDASTEDFKTAYESLDNQSDLPFSGSGGGFWNGAKTERKLFDRIVKHLHPSAESEGGGDTIETRRKTWRLLANFKFDAGLREEDVRRKIHSKLIAVVDRR